MLIPLAGDLFKELLIERVSLLVRGDDTFKRFWVASWLDASFIKSHQVVIELENKFAQYVGAKYACSVNSATNAIFLSMLNKNTIVSIPSMIPPVVANAIITSGNRVEFTDDVKWVGDSYILQSFVPVLKNRPKEIKLEKLKKILK